MVMWESNHSLGIILCEKISKKNSRKAWITGHNDRTEKMLKISLTRGP